MSKNVKALVFLENYYKQELADEQRDDRKKRISKKLSLAQKSLKLLGGADA